jgi:excisionase family DNA binding protein
MARIQPAGVWLSETDCARLTPVLIASLRDMHVRNGGASEDLVEIVAAIRGCAREFRTSSLVKPGSGTGVGRNGSASGSSTATERLTTRQAAQLTGLSDSYWRRLARKGDVTASRTGRRGEWILDGNSVAAWLVEHRN